MHQDSDCQKDHVYQLFPPETVCFVDESFDKRLNNEKARNRKIFFNYTLKYAISFSSMSSFLGKQQWNYSMRFWIIDEIECKVWP